MKSLCVFLCAPDSYRDRGCYPELVEGLPLTCPALGGRTQSKHQGHKDLPLR
jgi:hypothetical protein